MPCLNEYCINGTSYNYDGNYYSAGTYNGYGYWTGDTYVIYNDGNQWCLSTITGGTCLMLGKNPCTTTCPDFCEDYFFDNICPTPTPSPTTNCDVLDFQALFNCEYTPTPTPTPTQTQTPTPTPTPSQTEPCGYMNIDVTITAYTSTPTPTPTMTPSPSPEVTRSLNFSGDVTFNTIDSKIQCPISQKFQDCFNGNLYYTVDNIIVPGGLGLQDFMVFKANVNGISSCISYLGISQNNIGTDTVELLEGPLGYSNLGDCLLCVPQVSPSPTPTPTQTPTQTPTPTQSPIPTCMCYTFKNNTIISGQITYKDCLKQETASDILYPGDSFTTCVLTSYTPISVPPNTVTWSIDKPCTNGYCD